MRKRDYIWPAIGALTLIAAIAVGCSNGSVTGPTPVNEAPVTSAPVATVSNPVTQPVDGQPTGTTSTVSFFANATWEAFNNSTDPKLFQAWYTSFDNQDLHLGDQENLVAAGKSWNGSFDKTCVQLDISGDGGLWHAYYDKQGKVFFNPHANAEKIAECRRGTPTPPPPCRGEQCEPTPNPSPSPSCEQPYAGTLPGSGSARLTFIAKDSNTGNYVWRIQNNSESQYITVKNLGLTFNVPTGTIGFFTVGSPAAGQSIYNCSGDKLHGTASSNETTKNFCEFAAMSPTQCPTPPGLCYYNVPGSDGKKECEATPGFASWNDINHLCGLNWPGVSKKGFNLNPGQSDTGCLRK